MYPLKRLCNAIRAISPYAAIKFSGIPDPVTGNGDLWRGTISVGAVIILESTGTLDDVLKELTSNIGNLSAKIIRQLANVTPPGPFQAVLINSKGQGNPGLDDEDDEGEDG